MPARKLQPFFYYNFYTFEVTGPTVTGSSPDFNNEKQF
jgi:hypothetical protein